MTNVEAAILDTDIENVEDVGMGLYAYLALREGAIDDDICSALNG